MNLLYLGTGQRFYGKRFEALHRRRGWEIQFFLHGSCTFSYRDESGAVFQEQINAGAHGVTVVSGPECAHAWGGEKSEECEVAVFQFDEIDPLLARVIGAGGQRIFTLESGGAEVVRHWAARCGRERESPGFFSSRVFEIAGRELSLLLLRKLPSMELGPAPDYAAMKVAAALGWYRASLVSSPTLAEVAAAVHLSPAHLRRLFHRVAGRPPQQVMGEVQFERAMELMGDRSLTLERVAESAGFGSGSAFSRAFRKKFGVSPQAFRAEMGEKNRPEPCLRIEKNG